MKDLLLYINSQWETFHPLLSVCPEILILERY